jgi:predicted nucleic acid-binding protein
MRTAIDTNVISALWSGEPASQGIAALLGRARNEGGLVVCARVYVELLAYPNPALRRPKADGVTIVVSGS